MKKFSILTISTIFAVMFGMTACGEKVSNNLGGATRGNNAYDYNYDYSGGTTNGTGRNSTGTNGNNSLGFDLNTPSGGAGYWDYYGITNGSANDTMRNDLTNNYYSTTARPYQNAAYNNSDTMMGTLNTSNAMAATDSASIAD